MLAICPLAMFAQELCHHVFKVLTGTFWKRAYGDHVLLNFRWDSGINGNNTLESWMGNHCDLVKMTFHG
jgi:hypothetical protein